VGGCGVGLDLELRRLWSGLDRCHIPTSRHYGVALDPNACQIECQTECQIEWRYIECMADTHARFMSKKNARMNAAKNARMNARKNARMNAERMAEQNVRIDAG